jgi:hypothetical protein
MGCNQAPASLRVIHASLDGGKMDATLRDSGNHGVAQFAAIDYAHASDYQKIAHAGTFILELRAAGSAQDSPATVTSSPFMLNPGEHVSAVIAGLAGSGGDTAALQVIVQPETFGTPATADTVLVELINALPDVPDLTLSANTGAITSGTVATMTAATFSAPPGPLSFAASSTAGAASSFTTALPSDAPTVLVAIGLTSLLPRAATGFQLLQIARDGSTQLVLQDPIVYVLHASPDAAALDIYNGSTEVAPALAFASLSGPVQLPPGDAQLDLFAHSPTNALPASDPLTSIALPGLVAGQMYLAVATGFAGGRTPALISAVYQEGFTAVAGSPVIRAVQASPDLPAAAMGSADATPFAAMKGFANLGFLDASSAAGAALPAGYTLGIAPSAGGALVAKFPMGGGPDTNSFVVAAGATNPQSFDQPLQILAVDASSMAWAVTAISAQ